MTTFPAAERRGTHIHGQGQRTTAADAPAGQRRIHPRERGSRALLFVREFQADRLTGDAVCLPGNGRLCEAWREQAHEYCLEGGPADSTAKFLKKASQLAVR